MRAAASAHPLSEVIAHVHHRQAGPKTCQVLGHQARPHARPHGRCPPGTGGSGGARLEPSRRPGDRSGRLALLLLLGVPVALVVLVLWQFVMQTSAEFNETERITGVSAVLRELPAMLLLLVPVVAGLVLGVRSARLGSRRGVVAIWLYAWVLFLVGLMVFSSERFIAAVWVLFAAVAIAVLLLCLRAARPGPPGVQAATAPDRSPLAGRFRLAALLPIVGVAVAFIWLSAAQGVLSGHANGFVLASIPERGAVRAVTVPVDRAGAYFVYVEGSEVETLGDLEVQVTDPRGSAVPVRAVAPRPEYLHGWRGGYAVGTFDASGPGGYRVASTGTQPPVEAEFAPANPYGDFAVGDSVASWMRPHEWGVAAMLLVTVGSSIVLVVVAALRRRRSQAG